MHPLSRMPSPRATPFRVAIVVAGLVLGVAAISGAVVAIGATRTRTVAAGTAEAAAVGTARTAEVVEFDLPSTADWQPEPPGTGVRRWRAGPDAGGRWCAVSAAPQPAAAFPVGVMAAFAAQSGSAPGPNRRVPPPAGATAAVEQQRSFVLPAGGTPSEGGRLYVRHLLTRGGGVVTVAAAAPDGSLASCRPAEIVASIRVAVRTVPSDEGSQTPIRRGTLVLPRSNG